MEDGGWDPSKTTLRAIPKVSDALRKIQASWSVRWIAYRDPWCGIARVYIDGVLRGEIDTYAAEHLKQHVIYTIENLRPGEHQIEKEIRTISKA